MRTCDLHLSAAKWTHREGRREEVIDFTQDSSEQLPRPFPVTRHCQEPEWSSRVWCALFPSACPSLSPSLPSTFFPVSFPFSSPPLSSNARKGVRWAVCLGGNIATHPNPGEESSEATKTAMESEVGSSLTQEVLGIRPHTKELEGQEMLVREGRFATVASEVSGGVGGRHWVEGSRLRS